MDYDEIVQKRVRRIARDHGCSVDDVNAALSVAPARRGDAAANVPISTNPPHEVNVVVENPQGGAPVKYAIDKESGGMFVDRFLHTAMYFPGNYGFIPHTLSEDGTRSTAW